MVDAVQNPRCFEKIDMPWLEAAIPKWGMKTPNDGTTTKVIKTALAIITIPLAIILDMVGKVFSLFCPSKKEPELTGWRKYADKVSTFFQKHPYVKYTAYVGAGVGAIYAVGGYALAGAAAGAAAIGGLFSGKPEGQDEGGPEGSGKGRKSGGQRKEGEFKSKRA